MTNNILLIFRNPCLMPAAVGWATAQIIKVLLNLLLLRKLDVTRFVGAGGMPSAHSAFVTALTVSGYQDTEKQLRELLGHTPLEVVAGALLGIIISILWAL